jgi:hypothetical protein
MEALAQRLGSKDFDSAGFVKSQHINFPVLHYKPNSSDDFPKITCDFNSSPSIVSQLELKVNARRQANSYVGVVELFNNSDHAFSTQPNTFPIRLAWRVFPVGQTKRTDNYWPNRIDLDLMIRSNSMSQIPINIQLPSGLDDGELEFSLVQEGVAWFHERGMKSTVVMISPQ